MRLKFDIIDKVETYQEVSEEQAMTENEWIISEISKQSECLPCWQVDCQHF